MPTPFAKSSKRAATVWRFRPPSFTNSPSSTSTAPPADRALAHQAVVNILGWGLVPIDLADTAQAVAAQFARRLLHRRLLPEAEYNDALILAEASLAGIPLLTSSDHHLLDIDEAALLIEFNETDLLPVRVMHPKRLLKALR